MINLIILVYIVFFLKRVCTIYEASSQHQLYIFALFFNDLITLLENKGEKTSDSN